MEAFGLMPPNSSILNYDIIVFKNGAEHFPAPYIMAKKRTKVFLYKYIDFLS